MFPMRLWFMSVYLTFVTLAKLVAKRIEYCTKADIWDYEPIITNIPDHK